MLPADLIRFEPAQRPGIGFCCFSKLIIVNFKASILLRLRQWQNHAAALAGLHCGQLPVPFVDERAVVFDAPQLQELRRQRILPDAVGIGLALCAHHQAIRILLARVLRKSARPA